jgi:predicted PhzF superfamily epimerase YddE/YHI9
MQQCGVGLVEVRITDDTLAFRAPPLIRSGPLGEEELAEALKLLDLPREAVLDAVWADNGPGWQLLRLASAEAVLAVPAPRAGRCRPIWRLSGRRRNRASTGRCAPSSPGRPARSSRTR